MICVLVADELLVQDRLDDVLDVMQQLEDDEMVEVIVEIVMMFLLLVQVDIMVEIDENEIVVQEMDGNVEVDEVDDDGILVMVEMVEIEQVEVRQIVIQWTDEMVERVEIDEYGERDDVVEDEECDMRLEMLEIEVMVIYEEIDEMSREEKIVCLDDTLELVEMELFNDENDEILIKRCEQNDENDEMQSIICIDLCYTLVVFIIM